MAERQAGRGVAEGHRRRHAEVSELREAVAVGRITNSDPQKRPRIAPRPFPSGLCRQLVAVGSDSDTDAGRAEADAATVLVIATPFDIALAWRITVGIAIADDDTALTVFAPATTFLIADHADVLNVAVACPRHGGTRCTDRNRRSRSGCHEERTCRGSEGDRECFHGNSPTDCVGHPTGSRPNGSVEHFDARR